MNGHLTMIEMNYRMHIHVHQKRRCCMVEVSYIHPQGIFAQRDKLSHHRRVMLQLVR
jgi:hypothetical protein